MGYLLCGVIGTGKTFTATCFAGSLGIPALVFRRVFGAVEHRLLVRMNPPPTPRKPVVKDRGQIGHATYLTQGRARFNLTIVRAANFRGKRGDGP